ncbi:MAG: hypothetical protein R3321_02400 [Nitrososphaeraceae archaeon]|nr:hypothetical protein [Nitrososphaeraceae archaeon]
MEKKLIIVSGGDRVGKSTLIKKLEKNLRYTRFKERMASRHFSAPQPTSPHIFQMYYTPLDLFLTSNRSLEIWDRSYVCGYILERLRRNTHSHHSEVLALEFYLMEKGIDVLHVGIMPQWSVIAKRHYEEIKKLNYEACSWYQIDQLEVRRKEHNGYNKLLKEFYGDVTAFPNLVTFNNSSDDFIHNVCNYIANH